MLKNHKSYIVISIFDLTLGKKISPYENQNMITTYSQAKIPPTKIHSFESSKF